MDSRRNYSPWLPDTGLGNLCISNWDMAVSSDATMFELIINCSHREAHYARHLVRMSWDIHLEH